jgi:glycopeptide antibiotics resistance protein
MLQVPCQIFRAHRAQLFIYLVLLSYLVFTPVTDESGPITFFTINPMMEKILNFFLLMPLPILLHYIWLTLSGSTLAVIGALTSALIEIAQRWIPGRDSDWRDFLLNSSGAVVITLLLRRSRLKQSQR